MPSGKPPISTHHRHACRRVDFDKLLMSIAKPPERGDLREPGAGGSPFELSGFVLTRSCRPLSGAVVDLWHADDKDEYDNVGFRYRGHVITGVPRAGPGQCPRTRSPSSHARAFQPIRRYVCEFFPCQAAHAVEWPSNIGFGQKRTFSMSDQCPLCLRKRTSDQTLRHGHHISSNCMPNVLQRSNVVASNFRPNSRA